MTTFRKCFTDFNFGHTITVFKGKAFYQAKVDKTRVGNLFTNFDECLFYARNIVDDMILNKCDNVKDLFKLRFDAEKERTK